MKITSLHFSERTVTGEGNLDNLFGSDNIMERVLGIKTKFKFAILFLSNI